MHSDMLRGKSIKKSRTKKPCATSNMMERRCDIKIKEVMSENSLQGSEISEILGGQNYAKS